MKNYSKYLKLTLSDEKDNFDCFDNQDLMKSLNLANKELENYYTGKMRFILTNEDKCNTPDELKLSPKKKRKIKEIWLEFDSKISSIQRKYEIFLQNSLQNDLNDL